VKNTNSGTMQQNKIGIVFFKHAYCCLINMRKCMWWAINCLFDFRFDDRRWHCCTGKGANRIITMETTTKAAVICLLTLAILASHVLSFGESSHGFYDRPSFLSGSFRYPGLRYLGLVKRFGDSPTKFGHRPSRWFDWRSLYSRNSKRSFGQDDSGFGSHNSLKHGLWNIDYDEFGKRNANGLQEDY